MQLKRERDGSMSAFESWYNGMVGFQINSERILEDLDSTIYCDGVDPVRLRKWMVVCWNNALQEAQELVHPSHHVETIEELKEKTVKKLTES